MEKKNNFKLKIYNFFSIAFFMFIQKFMIFEFIKNRNKEEKRTKKFIKQKLVLLLYIFYIIIV